MDQKRSSQRPQKLDTQGVRNMVFALAVSSTIAFWAVFSKVDAGQFSGSESSAQISNELPIMEEEGLVVLDLPPIPTLVPTLDPSLVSPLAANGQPLPTTTGVALPTPSLIKLPPGDKTSLREGKAALKQNSGREKAASTRSS